MFNLIAVNFGAGMIKVFPVIHHLDENLTIEEAKIAYECGADGVFLISHENKDIDLPFIGQTIKSYDWKNEKDEDFFVGLNLLSTPVCEAFNVVKDSFLDAVWVDNPGVTSDKITTTGSQLIELSQQYPHVQVFASVAFKYQAVESDPKEAAIRARQFGWIPTTSGIGTGSAPEVSKLETMFDNTLAIASGMTPENVQQFMPYLSHILVATGVSQDEYRIDYEKLSRFVGIVKNS